MTFGELKTRIESWMREGVDDDLLIDAANDAIEALAMSIVQFRLNLLMGGQANQSNPVSLTVAAGTERIQLSTVVDPVVAPVCTSVAGSALPALAGIQVLYSLVTESGSETNLSPVTVFNRPLNGQLKVNSPGATAGAYGYNIYAGPANGTMAKQNKTPVDFNQPWTEDAANGVIFYPDNPSPAPTQNTTGDNILFIDHLEVQMPDGSWKAWNAAELDSEMMRRASRTLASSSPYQNYYWDLLGNQLEIRPMTGTGFVPRYFFAAKPRRIKYDGATIPFSNIPGAELPLRCFAISLLKLSVEEYQASTIWQQKSEAETQRLLKTINIGNRNMNNIVTPYIA